MQAKFEAVVSRPAAPPSSYHPYGLLAELTYRCPLHCPYCSNPTRYPQGREELSSAEWGRVFEEASGLGTLHCLFSGGEPLLRPDLPELVASARLAGMYTNLITSAIGLTRARAEALRSAGLDSVQISFQGDEAVLADRIAGTKAHLLKREAALMVRELGFPLTLNVVLHRHNIDRIEAIIAMAESLKAGRLELANTQFYGWAFQNRAQLLPSREQVAAADAVASAARERLHGRMEILYVLPDYHGRRPKPCMNGWGQRYLTLNPVGDVLPCPTATSIPDLRFDNVREHSLAWIWNESDAFNRFRGSDWMREPCRSCSLRTIDFGGCRCQAALLTGEAENTDPACDLAPHRELLERLVEAADHAPVEQDQETTFHYRSNPG